MSNETSLIHLLALRSLMRLFPIALVGIALAPTAQAHVYCVRNGAEMRNALNDAKANGENDQVRVRAGYMQTDGMAFSAIIEPNFSLNILGGWYGPNTQCDFVDPRPEATVIDGQGLPDTVFDIRSVIGDASSSFWLYNMTVTGGVMSSGNGGCVRVIGATGTPTINVERVVMTGCAATAAGSGWGGAMYVYNGGNGTIRVRNNVIRGNTGGAAAAALVQQKFAGTISFSNNTIVDNIATDASSDFAAMHVVNMAGSTGPVVFANNLFHGNTAAGQQELRYMSPSGPSYVTLRNNAMTMPLNGVPQSETGTIAPTASMFDPITLVPTRNSLLVNNATTNVTGGLGTVDFLNHPRNSNGAPDIGAIEADAEYLLVNGFE